MEFYEYWRDEEQAPKADWFKNNLTFRAHYHNNMEIIINVQGGCNVTVQGVTNRLNEGDVIVIHPGYTHLIEDFGTSICVMFAPVHLKKYLDYTADKRPAYDSVIRGDKELADCFTYFRERTEGENEMCLKGYINYLLGKCIARMRFVPLSSQNKNFDVVQKIVSYLLTHFQEKITLDTLAEEFSYNKYYLSELINKNLQCSLTEYLNRIRLEHFVTHFDEGRTVEAQLYESGFHSKQTFYRVYKSLYGELPTLAGGRNPKIL